MHSIPCALNLAMLNAGNKRAASNAMMTITTRSSISVNPALGCERAAKSR